MSLREREIPWQILRLYGYDDNLQLHIPSFLLKDNNNNNKSDAPFCPLSPSTISFLTSLFELFDIDNDGILTESDILAVFAILPNNQELPPWHPSRSHEVYKDAFSLPKLQQHYYCPFNSSNNNNNGNLSLPDGDSSFTADGITITSNSLNNINNNNDGTDILLTPTTAPTISNTGIDEIVVEQQQSSTSSSTTAVEKHPQPIHPTFTLFDWISYWIMSACISPTMTRVELYRLGHVDCSSDHNKKSSKRMRIKQQPPNQKAMTTTTSTKNHQVIRVRVFGKDNCGKTKLLSALCQIDQYAGSSASVTSTGQQIEQEDMVFSTPLTSCAHILWSSMDSKSTTASSNNDVAVHFVFTDIPEKVFAKVQHDDDDDDGKDLFQDNSDLIMLVFDCTDESSFLYLLDFERHLGPSKPRVFIGIRSDNNGNSDVCHDTSSSDAYFMDLPDNKNKESNVLTMATLHCSSQDLEPPLFVTLNNLQTAATATADNTIASSHAMKRATHTRSTMMTVLPSSSITPDKSFVLRRLLQYTLGYHSKIQGKLKSIPFQKKHQDDAKKTQIIWIGCGFFVLSAAVIFLWRTTAKVGCTRSKDDSTKWRWWRKNWFIFNEKKALIAARK